MSSTPRKPRQPIEASSTVQEQLVELQGTCYPEWVVGLCGDASMEQDFVPSCCGVADCAQECSCVVVLNGSVPAGLVMCEDGPHPLRKVRYHCRTHDRHFDPFCRVMCTALYQQHSWQEVQVSPLVVQHGEVYLSATLLQMLVVMYENRCTIKQIVDMVQEMWRAKHQEHWLQHVRNMGLTGMPDEVPTWWSVSRQHQEVASDHPRLFCCIY